MKYKVMTLKEYEQFAPDLFDDYAYLEEWDDLLVDTETKEVVWTDGGEPEDMTLRRDLKAFVSLLNEEALEVQRAKDRQTKIGW